MADPAEVRELGRRGVAVREEAIKALLKWGYGDETNELEHETMAGYVDALIDRPDVLRALADTFGG